MSRFLWILIIAYAALVGCFLYSVYGVGKEKPKVGQVWVYYQEDSNPFGRTLNDTMQVVAIKDGYVQFNGSIYAYINPRSQKQSTFLYKAKRIK